MCVHIQAVLTLCRDTSIRENLRTLSLDRFIEKYPQCVHVSVVCLLCVCLWMYVCMWCVCVYVCVHLCFFLRVISLKLFLSLTHTHTLTHTHIHTHARTHTYTHSLSLSLFPLCSVYACTLYVMYVYMCVCVCRCMKITDDSLRGLSGFPHLSVLRLRLCTRVGDAGVPPHV